MAVLLRNCVSMNPKNDSNSKAATDTKQRPANYGLRILQRCGHHAAASQ